MPKAPSELGVTEGNPQWAQVLKGLPTSSVEDKTENLIKTEYLFAMGVLSHVWSHILFEVEEKWST